MTLPPSNLSPNAGSFDQPMTRLEELLADRASVGLNDGEEAELRRLLVTAGTTEDASMDLAAAAFARAMTPTAETIAMPQSLIHALDREAEAWCAGVQSNNEAVVARIHTSTGRSSLTGLTDVGRGRLIRTPFKRFTREYGGWIAAAACLCFGVYSWNINNHQPSGQMNPAGPGKVETAGIVPTSISGPIEKLAKGLQQRAVDRMNDWFNRGHAWETVTLGSATPDAGADVTVGEVLWNPDDGTGVLRIKGIDDKAGTSRTFRVNVVCAKTGKRIPIETGAITLRPGQKDVLLPLDAPTKEMVRDASAFVVSVCSQGPMGVAQTEGIVGIGGAVETLNQPEVDGG
ncbi:MAG: hypothetical protein QM783_20300 [Phycisphaerales bacterium]